MQVEKQAARSGPESMPGFWINRASRLLVRRADAILKPFALALSYLPVFRALGDGAALSQTELARIAGVEQPSMAQTIARMERDGEIQREADPSDKRTTRIALTRKSRSRFPKAMQALREGEREALAGLSEAEQVLLRELLQRVVRNLEADR